MHLGSGMNPMAASVGAALGVANVAQILDTRARAATGLQVTLGPLSFNPAFPFTSTAAALANLPELPEAFWLATFMERKRANREAEKQLAKRDLERLQERIREVRKKIQPPEEKKEDFDAPPKKSAFKLNPDDVKKANEESKALIAQFIKDRTVKGQPSIRAGESERASSVYDIANDPGLKELNDRLLQFLSRRKPAPDAKDIYGAYQQLFPPLDAKDNPEAKLYEPVPFPEPFVGEGSFADPVFLVWRIEDQPAKTVEYAKISPEMKSEVARAWKLKKARVLAEEDAKKLADSLKALAQKYLVDSDNRPEFQSALAEMAFKNDKWKLLRPSIEIALLTEHVGLQPGTKPTFILPTIHHADIQYPLSTQPDREEMMTGSRDTWNGRRMAFQLLEIRSKPLGETVIVPDTPNMHYYVSVMVQKTPPSISSFYQVFRATLAPNARSKNQFEQPRDLFYGPFMQKGYIEFRDEFDKRLKADVKFRETEELKKNLEKRGDSGD
jgi:hypothetical protein